MSMEIPTQAQQASQEDLSQHANAEAEVFDAQAAQELLTRNGIESLADRLVANHDGEMIPLKQALVECSAARSAVEGAAEMAKEFGDGDVLAPMTKYLDKLSKQAQSPEAKKKEM